jgi:hypothetical protein
LEFGKTIWSVRDGETATSSRRIPRTLSAASGYEGSSGRLSVRSYMARSSVLWVRPVVVEEDQDTGGHEAAVDGDDLCRSWM